MSKWITDRPPKLEEATNEGDVWVYDVEADEYLIRNYEDINKGQPWMEIPPPPSYEKPKRWRVNYSHTSENWYIWNDKKQVVQLYYLKDFYKNHEAAERIAAIYEEAMP